MQAAARQPSSGAVLPSTPLTYGFFTIQFSADGAFSLKGDGWPTFIGTWNADGGHAHADDDTGVRDCEPQARYRYQLADGRLRLGLVSDTCMPRRMILDRSAWRPVGEAEPIPPRRIVTTTRGAVCLPCLPPPRRRQLAVVSRPRRCPASPTGSTCPIVGTRRPARTSCGGRAFPGLGHSSPVVWGNRVFVTTRHQQPRRARRSSPDSTVTAMHPTIVRRRSGRCIALDKTNRTRSSGNASPSRGRPSIPATSSRPMPAPRRSPTAAWSSRRSGRKASMPTTCTASSDGRPISATSRSAPTTFPASSGGRPAHRFCGARRMRCQAVTDWSSCRSIPTSTRLSSRSMRRPGRSSGRRSATSCRRGARRRSSRRANGPELVTNASKFIRGYDPRTAQGVVAARRQLEDHRANADLQRRLVRHRERPRARSGRSSPSSPAPAAT